MRLKRDYIIVTEDDFERNFHGDKEFENFEDLQKHLNDLVADYNRVLSVKGLHPKTQIANDRIELLLSQLFKS